MATVKDISYRQIPRQSRLFLDYLDRIPDALRFYQHPPTIESLAHLAGGPVGGQPYPRKEMASILRRQNESYGSDPETLRRISELEKPDCVAILTGQQVGLFTGPAYTIYKALTAVHISEKLRMRGVRALPIFWMDTEDHDLSEVTRCTVFIPPASVQTIDYGTALFKEGPERKGSVGSLPFTETIRPVVRDYLNHLPDSRHKQEVQSLLESIYVPVSTFALSFARLMTQLLRGSGLIFFDPQDLEAKRLASKIFEQALNKADAIHSALTQRNRELVAAGFHSQVRVGDHATTLFFHSEGERQVLEKRSSGFGLKDGDRTFSLQELLECSGRNPELFSPNVLLRPLVQDHLFPTVAYVGGPAEISYFAQIEVLYTLLKRPMPVVWPRNAFTLLEPEIAAEMNQLGLDIQDCFQGTGHVLEKIIRNSRSSEIITRIDDLHELLDRTLTEIRPEMQALELSLAQALDTARKKILFNTQRLKNRAIRLGSRENPSTLNTVDLLTNHCVPNWNLQEREFSILYFLARHGHSILDTIRDGIETGKFAHRVLQLEAL
jgi:bacillithiol biosynthesis cysteine-adding enzyme BshC